MRRVHQSSLSALPLLFRCCGGGQRGIHTPPGGFEEELPPSFGRSSAKGEVSNINALAKRRRLAEMRRRRKKLLTPPAAAAADASAAAVRADLERLIRRQASYSGRRSPPAAPIRIVGDGDGDDEAARGGWAEHHDAQRAARGHGASAAPAAAATQQQQQQQPATLLDDSLPPPHFSSTATASSSAAATAASALFPLPGADAGGRRPREEDGWRRERALERRFAVTPAGSVFGSDLDRLERDTLREHHQRGAALPPVDPVYRQFGAGRAGARMTWAPSSSFDRLPDAAFEPNRRREHTLGEGRNRNLSAYHMAAEAHRERYAAATAAGEPADRPAGINMAADAAGDAELPAARNPHFPLDDEAEAATRRGPSQPSEDDGAVGGAAGRVVVVDARRDYRPALTIARGAADDFQYDAYNQRPAEAGEVVLRGVEHWADSDRRAALEAHARHRRERFELERLTEGALDTGEVEHSTNRVRRETFLYFQNYPINEMIQEAFVRVREIVPKGGGDKITVNRVQHHDPAIARSPEEAEALATLNMDVDVPLHEARRMAREMGLDLIRIGSLNTQKSDRRVIALCQIGDHREHMRDMVRFKMQKLGVQPPPTRECVEVPFRGGTHPHAIRFKAVGIAKHLLHRHAVRVNLTKFGTPREGFPVLQTILDEVKKQCLQLRAFHKAGEIRATYNEIYCYLYPSTGRSPKTTVDHPSPAEVRAARDFFTLENEKEIYFDDLHDQITQRERLAYLTKLEAGTAWADKDEGMSLQRQRAIKVMLGYLPKGNKELYAARGDVNIPAPFRTSHMTSTERWANPVESNLEQASRGAAAIGKRAAMSVSEMHDAGETPENPTQLDRFYYKVQGPALEVGELKEALGLKDNRRKRPPLAGGFGTIGVGNGGGGFERHSAAK